jgi:hypothetical protein
MKKESAEERKKRLEKETAELRAEWKSWDEFRQLFRTDPEAARAAAEAARAASEVAPEFAPEPYPPRRNPKH